MRSLTGAGTDILHKHSINSILEQRQNFLNDRIEPSAEILSPMDATMTTDPVGMADMLKSFSDTRTMLPSDDCGVDLSSLNVSFLPTARSYFPLTPNSTQSSTSPGTLSTNSYEKFQFENHAQNSTPLKALQRNVSFDYSAPLSPSTPTSIYNRSFHSSPLVSDSSNSSSANGLSLDSIPLYYKSNGGGGMMSTSRSDSPESLNSNHSNPDYSLFNMMNLLSVSGKQLQPEQQQKEKLQQFPKQQQKEEPFLLQNTNSTLLTNDFKEQPFSNAFSGAMSIVNLEMAKLQSLKNNMTMNMLQAQQNQTPSSLGVTSISGCNNLNQIKGWQTNQSSMPQMTQQLSYGSDTHLDRVARIHRSSAAYAEATCTWSGHLSPSTHRQLTYSTKVFLGGIPWDISEQSLIQTFKPFGQIKVEWPGKQQESTKPKGYAYIIFESDKQVKALLSACIMQEDDSHTGGGAVYYFKMSSRRIKAKDVEVKPWIIGDSNYVKSTSQKLDPTKTVFVGALHGKLTAEGLATIMNDLFDGVLYAGIDTDKYKYPIGSGRVTFSNNRSYMKAVSVAFIEIRTAKFTKKVQIDPYLEDSLCSICGVRHGPYYCRELSCFRYFCLTCWQYQHNFHGYKLHKPLTRNSKSQVLVGIGPASSMTSLSSNSTAPKQQPIGYNRRARQQEHGTGVMQMNNYNNQQFQTFSQNFANQQQQQFFMERMD